MKICVYCRVSSDDQNTNMQIDEIKRYLDFHGWKDFQIFEDLAVSGSKESRPALNAMLAQIRAGSFDAIVVWKLDRLARTVKQLISLTDEFKTLGLDFISIKEQINTVTPVGKLMFHMIAAFAEFEREGIILRVKSGMAAAKARGVHLGRKSHLPKIKILELKASGLTAKQISKQLNINADCVRRIIRMAA